MERAKNKKKQIQERLKIIGKNNLVKTKNKFGNSEKFASFV